MNNDIKKLKSLMEAANKVTNVDAMPISEMKPDPNWFNPVPGWPAHGLYPPHPGPRPPAGKPQFDIWNPYEDIEDVMHPLGPNPYKWMDRFA